MKTWLPIASLSILLAACGGSDTGAGAAPEARQPLGGRSADLVPVAPRAATDYVELTQNLYMGFFGRPADAAGLAYWTAIFSEKYLPLTFPEWVAGYGVDPDVTTILDTYVNSVEAQDLYVSNNASFINAVYQNAFNRYSEQGGRDYWAGLIDRGQITRAQAVLSILSSAQGSDVPILARKAQAAVIFTSLLDGGVRTQAYATGGFNDGARDLFSGIEATTDLGAFRAEMEAFIATLESSTGYLVVRRYLGYHYQQESMKTPLYAAGYRYRLGDFPSYLATSGSLTYGAEPQTINWTRDDATGYTYGAPVTASAHLMSSNGLPSMSMLCSPVDAGSGAATKSTDVLVARTASRLSSAAEIAGQQFSVYRENCAVGGSHLASFKFEADGSGVFPVGSGVMTFDPVSVTALLNGLVLPDLSTGKLLGFAAYRYTRKDGSNGYFIVQHLGKLRGPATEGVVAVWAQE
ncbi:DUF4214 domain-containing protein [Duganella sp. PWIR1]